MRVLNLRGSGLTPATLPADTVYIGRRLYNRWPASKWGNPFKPGKDGTRAEVVAKYRAWLCDQPALMAALPELAGKGLPS